MQNSLDLERIVRLGNRLVTYSTSISNDPEYLDKCFIETLKETSDALKFKKGEIILIRKENGDIPEPYERNLEGNFVQIYSGYGWTKKELDENKKLRHNLPVKQKNILKYVLETGNTEQIYDKEEKISELIERKIIDDSYYKEAIEDYKAFLENFGEKGLDLYPTFSHYIRSIVFPLKIEIQEKNEIIGVASFDAPVDIDPKQPIPKDRIELGEYLMVMAMNSITVSVFADKLRRLQAEIVNTQRLKSLGEMAAGIAHDIGNFSDHQLKTIDYLTELIKTGELCSDELLEELSAIKRTSNKLAEWSQRVGRYSRGGKREVDYASLNTCVEDTLYIFRSRLEKDAITLKEILEPDIPKTQMVPEDINQVYTNLLHNSVDAIHAKKQLQSSTDYSPEIRITTYSRDNNVFSAVYDNGIGIPQDNLEQIFEARFSTKERVGEATSGLGLSICRKIIHDHQGEILVRSTEGKETEFTLRIPIV